MMYNGVCTKYDGYDGLVKTMMDGRWWAGDGRIMQMYDGVTDYGSCMIMQAE